MGLSSIEDVIKDAAKGKIFILVDDENRENEGDLCVLGEFASPEVINFLPKKYPSLSVLRTCTVSPLKEHKSLWMFSKYSKHLS